jgi:hypothetical protein
MVVAQHTYCKIQGSVDMPRCMIAGVGAFLFVGLRVWLFVCVFVGLFGGLFVCLFV